MRKRVRKNRYKQPSEGPPPSIWMRIGDVVFKTLRNVAFIVGMPMIFILVHDILTQCDYFKAKHIIIQGDSRLTPEQIMEIAKINHNTNILSVNIPTIEKRLRAYPWIAEAEVYREVTERSIIIFIKEHQALGVIDFGRLFVFDDQGEIFKVANSDEAARFPVVSGVDCSDWKSSGPPSQVFTSVMELLNMGKNKTEVVTNNMIKAIEVDREVGVTLKIDAPVPTVKLGYGNYRTKYDRLEKILTYIKEHEDVPAMDALDLRVPDHVTACLREDQGPPGEKKEVKGGKA